MVRGPYRPLDPEGKGIQLKWDPWNSVGYIKLPDLSSLASAEIAFFWKMDIFRICPREFKLFTSGWLVVIEAGASSYGFGALGRPWVGADG